MNRGRERRRRGFQPLREFGFDEPRNAPAGRAENGVRQLGGGHAGDTVGQLVCLVDDEQPVLGQHGGIGDGIDGQQCVVGDHDIGVPRDVARLLREAVGAERAACRAYAFPGRDADLGPRAVGHAGCELVAIAGLRRRRPGGESLDVAPECGARRRVEQLLLRPIVGFGRRAVVNLVQAQVVSPALEEGELRRAWQCVRQRLGERRQVAVDELALQSDGGGGNHHGLVGGDGTGDRRHQIGERLACAGACLYRQVLAGVERVRHGVGHLDLTAALAAAQRGDRDGEQVGDRRHLGRGSS